MSALAMPQPDETRPPLRTRVVLLWRKVRGWCVRSWVSVRPGPEARRGAVWGTLAAAAACVIIAGLCLRTGFGYAFDFALAIVVAAVAIPLIMLAVALLLTIARKLPRMATGMIAGSCAIVMVIWGPPQLGMVMAIAIGLVEGVLGATIATLVAGSFRQTALAKKIITGALCVLAVAANVVFVWFFVEQGSMEKLISWRPPANTMPAKLAAPNPSESGPYRVKMLFYSAGTDIRRPEYGSSAPIKTR